MAPEKDNWQQSLIPAGILLTTTPLLKRLKLICLIPATSMNGLVGKSLLSNILAFNPVFHLFFVFTANVGRWSMGLLCPNVSLPASKGKLAISALVRAAEFCQWKCVLITQDHDNVSALPTTDCRTRSQSKWGSHLKHLYVNEPSG